MPLLNTTYPCINTTFNEGDQIQYLYDGLYIQNIELVDELKDIDYWYCEIFMGECFYKYKIETIVPEDILNKIKTDDHTFLIICNAHESFHTIVSPIYKTLIIESGIPAKKIILVSESADLKTIVKETAHLLNQELVGVIWATIFEHGIRNDKNLMIESGASVVQTLEYKSYPKKFLNLNRRWRLHRPVTVAFLKILNLIDHGYVSIGLDDLPHSWCKQEFVDRWEKIYYWMTNRYNYDPEMLNLITSHREEILDMEPMYLDTEDLVTNRAILTSDTDYYYENTLFSLVSETNYYTDARQGSGRFLSEKTFKPISQQHPFILVTSPRTLELLRSIGYKTFHPWINEDYDLELNDDIRLKKILKEVDRICNFSEEQVTEFITNVRPIVEYNYTKLMDNKINARKVL
jgi:hypothetical protein